MTHFPDVWTRQYGKGRQDSCSPAEAYAITWDFKSVVQSKGVLLMYYIEKDRNQNQ